jgi:hypothetical protein
VDQRASERFVVDLTAEGTLAGRSVRVCVYDLSMDGCMVEAQAPPLPEQGQAIELTFPDGFNVSGKLAWTMGKNAGVQFASRLNETEVARRALRPKDLPVGMADQFGRKLQRSRYGQTPG